MLVPADQPESERPACQATRRTRFSSRLHPPGRQSDRIPNVLFNSVHGTEGQEADCVVDLDLKDDRYGSPCVVEDDPLLGVVMPPKPPETRIPPQRRDGSFTPP